MTSLHESAIRILAAEQSPLGVAATHVLAELDAGRAEIVRLTEENRALREHAAIPPQVSAVVDAGPTVRLGLL